MKDRPTRALVAVLSGVGAVVGGCAAVVWHVAVRSVPGTEQPSYQLRPEWFPLSLYFVAAGTAVGLIAASLLIDAGLRVSSDRSRSPGTPIVLLLVLGALLGSGAAAAWNRWPPVAPDP